MKKLIAAALVLICILSMVGCDNRSMDKDLNEVVGTITFYSEPIREAQDFDEPITGQIRVELDKDQADKISAIIDNVDEWVDDRSVDRLAYYFDGEIELADSEFVYYFTYEYNVIYYDHYFAEITDEEMQLIKDIEPTEQIINDATIAGEKSEEIFDTPVDLVAFSNIDDFSAYLLSAEKNEDMADLASLTHYFLPTGIPEGYKLHKITAGVSDIGFWYLPDEFLSSIDATLEAEALQKHFLFISTRGTYEFGSVLAQFEATQDDLIDGRYLLRDGSEKLVIWEQNGATLMMYLPKNYAVADLHTLCETEQYTKNARTGVFECVQE